MPAGARSPAVVVIEAVLRVLRDRMAGTAAGPSPPATRARRRKCGHDRNQLRPHGRRRRGPAQSRPRPDRRAALDALILEAPSKGCLVTFVPPRAKARWK